MAWLLKKFIIIGFWLGVTLSLLVTVFVLGAGQLLPYLDHYRPQIERNLEQILGYDVILDKIDGQLEGVDPTFSVSGFRLTTPSSSDQPNTAVSINELRVRLDLIKSILTFKPQFTYIRFVRPSVSLEEKDGQWLLHGARPVRSVQNDVGIERILDYLSEQRNFSIYDADVHIASERLGNHLLKVDHVYIYRQSFQSLLKSRVYLDDNPTPFIINAEVNKSLSLLGGYRVKASIAAPRVVLPIADMFPSSQLLASLELGGDIWLDALIGKELDVRSEMVSVKASFKNGQQYEATTALKLNYNQKQPGVRVDLANMSLKDQDGRGYPATNATFDWSSVTERSNIRFDQVDLDLTQQLALLFLPESSNAASILKGLAPRGMAKNGVVRLWKDDKDLSFQLVTNLQTASVQSYNGIPKANNVNAVFSLSEDNGYIDFRGENSEILFDTVYDKAWLSESLSGYVSWQKIHNAFLVSGRDLSVQRNGGDVRGGFRLEVRDEQPDWIGLDLQGKSISLADRLTYVPPNALGDGLSAWIRNAISDSGSADSVDILVHSELSKGAKPHVRMQMAVSEANIKFDENWPEATNLEGRVELNKEGVFVDVASASLNTLMVEKLAISVPIRDGSADWLNISGEMEEQASRLMPVLVSTPLGDTVLKPFEDWTLQGVVAGRFDIAIPLIETEQPIVDLALRFQDNVLLMEDIGLEVGVQQGQLNYQSDKGIFDSTFDIKALGGGSRLALSSVFTESNELAIIGDLSGRINVSDVVQWRDFPESVSKNLSGDANYTGQFAVNRSQNGQFDLTIDSNLSGALIDFPAPIGKSSLETTPFKLKIMLHENDLVVDTDYNNVIKSRFLLRNAEFIGGEVVLQGKPSVRFSGQIPKGLSVIGSLEEVNVEDWQPVLNQASDNSNPSPISLRVPSWLGQMDLIIDNLVINEDNSWHNFKVSYGPKTGQALQVSSDEMNVTLTQKGDLPSLDFGFLSWNTSSNSDDSSPTSPPISAQQIPSMNLSIDQFYLNGQPYGDWQLRVAQQGNNLRIDPITSQLKTGDFKGSLFWQGGVDHSSVELSISAKGDDLAELTKKYSSEAFVSSSQYKIDVGLSWLGHPFYFDRQSVSGRIAFQANNGNFNKVDELPVFLKALGIFNIGALSRRLLLDFSDVYKPGLTYDKFSGTLSLDKGILKTLSPVTIISPTAELVVEGEADIVSETLNEKLTATFPISGTLPLAGLLWGSPQLAGLLFITDKLIGDQLSKVTSVQYKVEGSFDNPVMTPIRFQPIGKQP